MIIILHYLLTLSRFGAQGFALQDRRKAGAKGSGKLEYASVELGTEPHWGFGFRRDI